MRDKCRSSFTEVYGKFCNYIVEDMKRMEEE